MLALGGGLYFWAAGGAALVLGVGAALLARRCRWQPSGSGGLWGARKSGAGKGSKGARAGALAVLRGVVVGGGGGGGGKGGGLRGGKGGRPVVWRDNPLKRAPALK